MNWKVFDKTLRDFAEEQCLELSVEDFNHFYGQITCYKLIETDSIFYEVRHAKPLEEYGSKFRICSKVQAGSLSIKSRGPFFFKVKVSISQGLDEQLTQEIRDLSRLLRNFSWEIQPLTFEWPAELYKVNCLIFETKKIHINQGSLRSIRNVHKELMRVLEGS